MSTADPRGKFVWHELWSADTAAAGAFYPKVVSWKSQPWEHDASYTVMMAKSGPVGGIMGMPSGGAAHWIPYIGVDDPHATVAQAKSMGGKVVKDVSSIPNGGQFAVLTDPQGAEFAIYKSSQPGNGAAPGSGDFGWHELSTSDADAALSFYSKLFGWEIGPKHDMGDMGMYHLFLRGGEQYGGVFKSPPGDTPNWLCYVRVDDVGKAANAVKAAGGRVLNGPMEVPGGTWIAQALDPEGVAFAVMEVKGMAAAEPAKPPAKPAAAPKPKAAPKPAAAAPASAPAAAPSKPAAPAAAAKPAAPAAPKPAAAPATKPAAAPAASAPKPPMKATAPKKAKKPAKKAASKAAAKKAKPAKKKAKKAVAKKAAGKKKPAAKKKAKARKHR
jgi:predicted enzyme related to lactoylglutathione lyase